MKYLLIYHRIDFDGLGSCMVIKSFLQELGHTVEAYGFNYGDPEPPLEGFLANYDGIILTDISLPPENMQVLAQCPEKVRWIDHHVTAIEDSIKGGYSEIPGLRREGTAAIELAWEYVHPNQVAPLFIQYLGAYDIWDHSRFDWETITLPLQYILKSKYGVDLAKFEADWGNLLSDPTGILSEGCVILKYLRQQWEQWVKSYGFEVTVAGQYKGICLMSPMYGSSWADCVATEYDLYLVVNRKEPDKFILSMYGSPDNPRLGDFSCGQYLHDNFGGGGHPRAAGSRIPYSVFERLIKEQVI